ncbi:MAG TPA: hypothetical protein VHP33_13920 [Polyangiaceae bacterium]|nr:hypothetical protein [Polyangiaceae bacterium]
MPDYVLIDGDQALFMPTFGAATVVVRPGSLRAGGAAQLEGKRWCVAGDEASVSVPGCMYMTPTHSIPGTGTLEIDSLASDQQSQQTTLGGAAVLLLGSSFTAKFSVQSPAQQPTAAGPVPDPMTQYSGSGQFLSTNSKLKVT